MCRVSNESLEIYQFYMTNETGTKKYMVSYYKQSQLTKLHKYD